MTTRVIDLFLDPGNHAARPAASAVPVGSLYPCSDHGIERNDDGAAWSTWDPIASGLTEADIVTLVNDDTTPSALRAALDAIYLQAGTFVESIVAGTNVTVDSTDPANPIVSASGGGGGLDDAGVAALVDDDTTPSATRASLDAIYAVIGSGGTVDSIVAGTNVTVDATDPANPIVSATGGGGGGGVQVDVYDTAQTATAWAKPVGAVTVEIFTMGAGSGGGSGRKGAAASARGGGGGGGRGGFARTALPASALPSTLYVWVGAGGNGGAARTTNSTNGSAGGDGGVSFVTSSSSGSLGTARSSALIYCSGGNGALGGSTGTTTAGSGGSGAGATTVDGGAGGGSSGTSGGGSGQRGGGGGGGGINAGDALTVAGSSYGTDTTLIAGLLQAVAPTGDGEAGPAGSTVAAMAYGPTPGVGGAGGRGSKLGNGGAGGNGVYGGGGGGGGASVDSVGDSGAGGNGGDGYVVITTYF